MYNAVAVFLFAVILVPGVSSAAVYVDQNSPGPAHDGKSWDTAFLTIQTGANAATPGGEVWVGDGTYVENITLLDGVQLYGGFLGAETGGYEESLDQRDIANHVAVIDGGDAGPAVEVRYSGRLDGLTITRGAPGINCPYRDLTECRLTIAHCRVLANQGGLYCKGYWVYLTVTDSEFADNSECGAYTEYRGPVPPFGEASFTGCRFSRNQGEGGGGVLSTACDLRIEGCTFDENTSACPGAVFARLGRHTISHSVFIGNVGGGHFASAVLALTEGQTDDLDLFATIANNIFYDNTGLGTGGAIALNMPGIIVNNTIVGNESYLGGAGILAGCGEGTILVANNIVVGNRVTSERGGAAASTPSTTVP